MQTNGLTSEVISTYTGLTQEEAYHNPKGGLIQESALLLYC